MGSGRARERKFLAARSPVVGAWRRGNAGCPGGEGQEEEPLDGFRSLDTDQNPLARTEAYGKARGELTDLADLL